MLKDEMFRLIEDWKNSGLSKLDFLKDKKITKDKFGYWLAKYNKQNKSKLPKEEKQDIPPIFKEITLPDVTVVRTINKVIELTTRSGLKITVFG
ncbi:MAG: hypothetical protein HYR91_07185 [Flavobacteriia bacterium]|nr:hypothetical protein [Flavobacteriia bacterium]